MADLPTFAKSEIRSLRSLEAQAQNLLERTYNLEFRIQERVTTALGIPIETRLEDSLDEAVAFCGAMLQDAAIKAWCAQQAYSEALYTAMSDTCGEEG